MCCHEKTGTAQTRLRSRVDAGCVWALACVFAAYAIGNRQSGRVGARSREDEPGPDTRRPRTCLEIARTVTSTLQPRSALVIEDRPGGDEPAPGPVLPDTAGPPLVGPLRTAGFAADAILDSKSKKRGAGVRPEQALHSA